MTMLAVLLSVAALYISKIWIIPAVFFVFFHSNKNMLESTQTLFTLFNVLIPYILWHTFNFYILKGIVRV